MKRTVFPPLTKGGPMKSSKFWIAVAVAGVAMNIIDYVFQGMLFSEMIYKKFPQLFNMSPSNIPYYMVGDFITVLVFAWVYDKVYSSFGGGPKGGMMAGMYAGILVNFPTWIFAHLTFNGFPYWASWVFTIYGIVWYNIAGTIIGALYKKGDAPAQA